MYCWFFFCCLLPFFLEGFPENRNGRVAAKRTKCSKILRSTANKYTQIGKIQLNRKFIIIFVECLPYVPIRFQHVLSFKPTHTSHSHSMDNFCSTRNFLWPLVTANLPAAFFSPTGMRFFSFAHFMRPRNFNRFGKSVRHFCPFCCMKLMVGRSILHWARATAPEIWAIEIKSTNKSNIYTIRSQFGICNRLFSILFLCYFHKALVEYL